MIWYNRLLNITTKNRYVSQDRMSLVMHGKIEQNLKNFYKYIFDFLFDFRDISNGSTKSFKGHQY